MFLVVDANVVISSLLPGSKSFDLLSTLHKTGYELLSPDFMLSEVIGKLEKLSNKTGISKEDLIRSLNLIVSWLKIVSKSEYSQFLQEASKISPDKKDITYFALSLKFEKCPIWSREPRLKKQKVVKVLNDKEVEKLLKSKV